MCFQKRKLALVGVFLGKNPMTNKIKKFLYTLEHLIPDAHEEIPTFAFYHPMLSTLFFVIFSGSGAHTEELLTFFQQPWKFAS